MLRGNHPRKKGGVFSNYCGLGGSGSTQHPTDVICKQHDKDYGDYEDEGRDPYWHHNMADDIFRQRLKKRASEPDIETRELSINYAGQGFAVAKKAFPEIPDSTQMPTKKPEASKRSEREYDTEENMSKWHRVSDSDESMEPDDSRALVTMGGTITPAGSRETPIIAAPPKLGLADTHTAVCSYTCYVSVYKKSATNPVELAISMVDPRNPVTTTITHKPASDSGAFSAVADKPIPPGNSTSYTASTTPVAGDFPQQPLASDNRPAWWNFWTKMYDSYTVLGCHYNIVMQNPGYRGTMDVMMGSAVETYTASDTTNKIPTDKNWVSMHSWPNIKWKLIPGNSNIDAIQDTQDGNFSIVNGSYRPGQANRLVQNDQDTKTWHRVTESPILKEDLHMFFFSSGLSYTGEIRVNMEITQRFIVQFKDLAQGFRYPSADSIALSNYTDTAQSFRFDTS